MTDDATLVIAKEASGRLRVEIEALLSMGLPNSPMAGADIRVASGNFIMARPIGIIVRSPPPISLEALMMLTVPSPLKLTAPVAGSPPAPWLHWCSAMPMPC